MRWCGRSATGVPQRAQYIGMHLQAAGAGIKDCQSDAVSMGDARHVRWLVITFHSSRTIAGRTLLLGRRAPVAAISSAPRSVLSVPCRLLCHGRWVMCGCGGSSVASPPAPRRTSRCCFWAGIVA
eukprot:9502734-Pyramimonas_sp.AAC.1